METVTVAELKARLGHYLREVRAGQSFTVVSHGVPVATLSPYVNGMEPELEYTAADPTAPRLWEPVLGQPTNIDIDAVELIRADRDDKLDELTRRPRGGSTSTESPV